MSTTFIDLVRDQFVWGGKKYAGSKEKETTDILTDDYGLNGLLWSINKYVYRFVNLGQEKELLKIACYMFILYLKLGFHINELGTACENYTTVEVKNQFFDKFILQVRGQQNAGSIASCLAGSDINHGCNQITQCLKELRLRANHNRERLFRIFTWAETLWYQKGFDQQAEHKTDTGLAGSKDDTQKA